jgi:2-oxoglutarate dehydrogenase E2 component (dihydrolipoamide succinyltransferase)
LPVELKVPTAGESISKVQIGPWKKAEGQPIRKDEPLVEIETDKATMELPSPVTGVLTKILKREGDSAEVGELIGYVEEAAAGAKAEAKPAAGVPAAAGAAPARPAGAPQRVPVSAAAEADGKRVMPAARRALAEAGLSAEQVPASGPGGRLLKEDVENYKAPGGRGDEGTKGAVAVRETRAGAAGGGREEDAVPMSPLRRTVAARLVEAQNTAAMLTTFNECDMSAVMALRARYQEAFQGRYQIKVGFMSFFVKAAIDALRQVPQVNAEIRELPDASGQRVPHIVYRNYYDIGVAVSGGKGLVVPVIRNAERLSFAEIEQVIADFGARGRENKIKLEELQGGTFTISNGGIFGSLMSTPILNPPQSGILGLHAIQDRPVARDGQVVIRPMMYLALTYDHRIIDGREAVTFLKRIKEVIEDPTRMLIEV